MTGFLQPLDQGIIASFKAAYRRKYAEKIVQKFNSTGRAPSRLDILATIRLVAAAWDDVPSSVIFNCWQKSGICLDQFEQNVGNYDNFIQSQSEAVRELVQELDGSLLPHELDEIVNEFIGFGEDQFKDNLEDRIRDVPPMESFIQDAISKGIFEHGIEGIRRLEELEFPLPDLLSAVRQPSNTLLNSQHTSSL
ncbi:Tigger transposable element-derived protein 4 [Rhizina undulata]